MPEAMVVVAILLALGVAAILIRGSAAGGILAEVWASRQKWVPVFEGHYQEVKKKERLLEEAKIPTEVAPGSGTPNVQLSVLTKYVDEARRILAASS